MEIAVFGGTFDPPTITHQAIMQACVERPDIDEVWVMPCGARLDKVGVQDDATRLMMLGLVKQELFADDDKLKITDFEQRLSRPTYTAQTAAALEREYPDNQFWFVYGADSYRKMPTWEHGEALQQKLHMLLVAREGLSLPEESQRIRHLNVSRKIIDQAISSTKVREAIAHNQPIDDFVSHAVALWVKDNHAYVPQLQNA